MRDQFIALQTIVRREVNRFLRIWMQTLLPPVITQTLYFVVFGRFIGDRIGPVQGVSYMAFIVPGLVMMAVINSAYSNVVSSFFSAKFQRSIEELLVSPVADWVILSGYVAGGVLRGLVGGRAGVCHLDVVHAAGDLRRAADRGLYCADRGRLCPGRAWSTPSSPRSLTISRSSRPLS